MRRVGRSSESAFVDELTLDWACRVPVSKTFLSRLSKIRPSPGRCPRGLMIIYSICKGIGISLRVKGE